MNWLSFIVIFSPMTQHSTIIKQSPFTPFFNLLSKHFWQSRLSVSKKQELSKALRSMAKGKAPDINGLMTKVFCRCWRFIKDPYFDLVIHFWEIGELYPQFHQGVLKLIPKKADYWRIWDWRPLAMLATAYKILAKLIALCL